MTELLLCAQTRQQLLKDRRDRFINGLLVRVHYDLGILWSFVGGINSSEFTNLSRARLFIEIFWIARFADFQRRINEYFNKFRVAFERDLPRTAAIHSIRRDERGDYDRTCVGHQFRHFTNAANVLHPIVWRETKIRGQAVPDIVA